MAGARAWWRRRAYFHQHVAYIAALFILGGGVLCAVERAHGNDVTYLSALFQAGSAASQTGLISLDMSLVSVGGQVVVFLLILLGSNFVSHATIPLVRLWAVQRTLAARGVAAGAAAPPPWTDTAELMLRERALRVAVALEVAYFAVVQFAAFVVLALHVSFNATAAAVLASRSVSPLWFAAFDAVSSFNNAG